MPSRPTSKPSIQATLPTDASAEHHEPAAEVETMPAAVASNEPGSFWAGDPHTARERFEAIADAHLSAEIAAEASARAMAQQAATAVEQATMALAPAERAFLLNQTGAHHDALTEARRRLAMAKDAHDLAARNLNDCRAQLDTARRALARRLLTSAADELARDKFMGEALTPHLDSLMGLHEQIAAEAQAIEATLARRRSALDCVRHLADVAGVDIEAMGERYRYDLRGVDTDDAQGWIRRRLTEAVRARRLNGSPLEWLTPWA